MGLVDEVARLNGRLKSVFAPSRQEIGLAESVMMVLNAVVEAERPPTVSQIGRSLGHPRQRIQRAANALEAAGLIESAANPDHKRAVLLVATPRGIALKRKADERADVLAGALGASVELEKVRTATRTLRTIRKQLEAGLRGEA